MVTNSAQVRSSKLETNQSVTSVSKNPPCSIIAKNSNKNQIGMLLEWGLILSVTSVSVTMLMIVGAFIAILEQTQLYYQVGQSEVVLLFSSFNIAYVIITPIIFNAFNKHYVNGVLISTVATGIAAVGRYLAGRNYTVSLLMTAIVAVSHIPIITAPYGLLKLFPDWQKGYAASIPLFLPVLGINFCILYGMEYISDNGEQKKTPQQIYDQIDGLNGIIAIAGIISTILTITLTLLMKKKIQAQPKESIEVREDSTQLHQENPSTSTDVQTNDFQSSNKGRQQSKSILQLTKTLFTQKRTTIVLIAWGTIVGINWTYGTLFGIIFTKQSLTKYQVALIGLSANLSSAVFSNLGTFIKNRFNFENMVIIEYLNLFGIAAAIIVQLSRQMAIFQDLYFLIFIIIILRAGFSSFVSLAFVEMERQGISSLIVSAFFFWIANLVNFLTMELLDFAPTDAALLILTLAVSLCVFSARRAERYMSAPI